MKRARLQGLGIDEVLPRSISAEDLNALIQNALDVRARAGQARSGETSEGTLISVGQARGGVGATSLAVNLARALAHEKRTFSKDRKSRVVLIDLDLQFGDAHVHLDIEDNGAFQGLLEAGDDPDQAYILGMLQKHSSGLEILNAPASIAPLQSLSGALVSTMLTHLKSEFDYVIADLPRAMVDWVEPVLFQSSRLLLVTDTSVPSIRQTRRISDFYKEANIGLPVELVVNFESKPLFKSRHHKDAEAALEATFAHWIPANTKVARRAGDLGRAAVEIAPGSDIGKAYSGIAQQIQNDFPHKSIHAKGA